MALRNIRGGARLESRILCILEPQVEMRMVGDFDILRSAREIIRLLRTKVLKLTKQDIFPLAGTRRNPSSEEAAFHWHSKVSFLERSDQET